MTAKKAKPKKPEKAMTLLELVEAVGREAPAIDDQVEAMLIRYPELSTAPKHGSRGTNFMLGRIVAIWTMDFICRTYGRPDLGYRPSAPGMFGQRTERN